MDGLGDLHLRFNFRQIGSLKCLNDIVVTSKDVLLDEWRHKFCSLADILQSFLFLLLEVLLERIQFTYVLLLLVLELHELLLLLFVHAWDINQEKTLEPRAHFLFVSKRIQADNQVESHVEIWRVIHYVLIHLYRFAKALLLDKSKTDILFDLEFHLFVLLSGRINGHIVVLDSHIVFLLLEVDVAHVDTQAGRLGILLVLQNDRVTVDCLGVQSIRMVHVSQVVEHVESQVNVNLIERACLFTQRSYLLFLCGSFFGFLERIIIIFSYFSSG